VLRDQVGLARCRSARGGGFGNVQLEGAERLDDQVDEADQQGGNPAPAAVRGNSLRERVEVFDEPGLGGLGGWGGAGHSGMLDILTVIVKR
jgi:hypothetical protein